MDEAELVAACCRGEEAAWRRFIDDYALILSSAVRHCLRSFGQAIRPDLVEDLTEEVLLELVRDDFKALRAFRGEASLRAYLFVFARRRCVHFIALERRRQAGLQAQVERARESPVSLPDARADGTWRGYRLVHVQGSKVDSC